MNTIPEPFALCNVQPVPIAKRWGFRVPFGLRDGRFWAPGEVERGSSCACVCPGCGAALAAKALDSRRKRPHFAHLAAAGCATGGETGIHGRAKQLIAERLVLLLPAWAGDLENTPNPPVARDDNGVLHRGRHIDYPAQMVHLTSATVERALGGYQPDVYAFDQAGELLIEVRVTHAVDAHKAERVQRDGRRMVEIDLSGLDRRVPHDPVAFEHAVLSDATNRHWISCPDARSEWLASKHDVETFVAERNREIAEQRARRELAERQRQGQQAMEARDKRGRKAYMRHRLRAKHAEDLAQLMALTEPDRIDRRLDAYRTDAAARVEALLVPMHQAPRSACLRAHHDAWVFGVDPALWQALAYRHFIESQQPGYRFNRKDMAAWVRTSFCPDRALYRLFIAQYAGRAEARRAGFPKQTLDFWPFTDEENARIPNFYEPVNDFVFRLEASRLLRMLPSPIGECEVLPPPASGWHPIAQTAS